MRHVTGLFAVLAAFAAAQVAAQGYPDRPIRVIVPFAPGGATDIVARVVGQKLNEAWGQTVVIDNRAGAGGNIGGELAAKANPDGYTVFMTTGSIVAANPHMYRKMPFNPDKDLLAVTMVASGPQIVTVNPGFAAKTFKDFIALARAKPKSISFGSAGFGTQTHLAGERVFHAAGIELTHIPYKGEGPALTDLVGGQIQVVTPNLAAAIGFVQQGKLRALAITSRERLRQLPDVPAVAETIAGFENLGWFGYMVPAGTPKAVIDRIHADTVKVLQAPEIRTRFEQLGMVPVGDTPAEFAKKIRDETATWGRIIRERKLMVE